jgi:hypothetical protein
MKHWIVRIYLSEARDGNNLYYEVDADDEDEAYELAKESACCDVGRDQVKWADYTVEPYTEERSWGKL